MRRLATVVLRLVVLPLLLPVAESAAAGCQVREGAEVALLADVVQRADMRMVERRGRLGLALKALERRRILQQLRGKELDRHLPAEPRVLRAVDDTPCRPRRSCRGFGSE